MKKYIGVFIISFIVFLVSTFAGVMYILNSDMILKNFNITSVTNDGIYYKVKFEKIKGAKEYKIVIVDENNIKIFETITTKNENDIVLTNLQYNNDYSLMVYAYDKVGDFRPANKEYVFKWDEPSIIKDDILLNNEDYVLNVNGILNKNYIIKIKENEKELLNEKIEENEYKIPSNLYKDKSVVLNVSILKNDTIIDEINLYNNINPVTNLKILTPTNDSTTPHSDLALNYEGGNNATNFEIKIYKDNKLVKTANTTKRSVILSRDLFEKGGSYKLEVNAIYGDYRKSSSVNFTMSSQDILKPVYISNNWRYVKKGSKITLKSPDVDAKIYYTVDGSNPESNGILYTEPITINENTTIKTVAVSDDKHNSIVKSYDINVGKKKNLVVYLSPSNQEKNIGVESTGFTNERDEMNDLSNFIEERLKDNGVRVLRNDSSGNINLWLKESNYAGADLHIAIHSNASNDHKSYGVETWIHLEESNTYSLANLIQDGICNIYGNKDLTGYNRGVKYANGALGEVNDNYLPFGILVEVAHHDYERDALWIMQNKKLIGYNIADSILKYYQIID